MTRFQKDQFAYDGGYLTYGPEHRFVARFKYAATSSKARWIKFMVENFSVEEYFAAHDAGRSPLEIMESKGFVLTHILKWLRTGQLQEWKGRSREEILA